MSTDARGHTVPASTDHPSRAALTALSLSIRDAIPVASATARAALITTLSGLGITASVSNPIRVWRADAPVGAQEEITVNGTNWAALPTMASPTAYTPALTASTTNPTLGTTGSLDTGEFSRVGKVTTGWFTYQFGSAGMSAGSGTYYMSLPVPAAVSTTTPIIGTAWLFTGSWQPAIILLASATTVQFRTGAALTVGSAVPAAWTAAYSIRGQFQYTAA